MKLIMLMMKLLHIIIIILIFYSLVLMVEKVLEDLIFIKQRGQTMLMLVWWVQGCRH